MFIDINKIGPEGAVIDARLDLPDLEERGVDPVQVHSAHLRGTLDKGDGRTKLEAHLEALLGVFCSRCLAPVEEPVTAGIFLILDAGSDEPGERSEGEDAGFLYPVEDGVLNLDRLVLEQLYLSRRPKPICSPECKGLCPFCGTDRNRVDCRCAGESVDPRMAPLLKLLKGKKS